jgi:hypothetical protein
MGELTALARTSAWQMQTQAQSRRPSPPISKSFALHHHSDRWHIHRPQLLPPNMRAPGCTQVHSRTRAHTRAHARMQAPACARAQPRHPSRAQRTRRPERHSALYALPVSHAPHAKRGGAFSHEQSSLPQLAQYLERFAVSCCSRCALALRTHLHVTAVHSPLQPADRTACIQSSRRQRPRSSALVLHRKG